MAGSKCGDGRENALQIAAQIEWPTEPRWLTCDKSLLRNGMPSHSRMWPGWWPAWGEGAKLLWLHMDLPHATEVPDTECKINEVYGQQFFFSCPYYCGRVQSSMLQATKVNTNRTVWQAILANFWLALPTRLSVLLIPWMPDAYKLYLVVKWTNKR